MAKTVDPINGALGSRKLLRDVQVEVAAARQFLHDELVACEAYANGLPGEIASATTRTRLAREAAKLAARRAVLARRGRPIDLVALLQQRRQDGTPLWAVADPMRPVGDSNGKLDTDGTIAIGGLWRTFWHGTTYDERPRKAFVPQGGIPPLPPAARRLATDKAVRRHAAFVALLYQPDSWREVDPDPAIVVEWRALPGQYFALAVWGGDRAQIMEFVN